MSIEKRRAPCRPPLLGLAAVLFASSPFAPAAEVAPPPREAAPARPGPAAAQDPAATVERIVRNAADAGGRLARRDPGSDTRRTQDGILRDIDSLIQRQENPPPMGDAPDPMPKPTDGGSGSGGPAPMPAGSPSRPDGGGQARAPRPHRNRPRESTSAVEPRPGANEKERTGSRPADGAKPDAKKPEGVSQAGDAAAKAKAVTVAPSLPLDGEVAKDVWGHLPEKLREQISAYYKEQFMPQYADLLRQYYSSLAERDRTPNGGPNR